MTSKNSYFQKALEKSSASEVLKKLSKSTQTAQEALANAAKATQIPDFRLPSLDRYEFTPIELPTQEDINEYQSASAFMKATADAALEWKETLPEGYQPAILAILYGGIQLQVENLAQVSFHGIRVQGTFDGCPCTMLAHQSTVQILCYAQEIAKENPKNPIGFIWSDNKVSV